MPKQIITPRSAPTTGFTSRLLVSGQGRLYPETREVVGGDIDGVARLDE